MKNVVLTISFLMMYLAGCATDPGTEAPGVESKILITLREDFSGGVRKLSLDCKTEMTYPCLNYTISNQLQKNGNNIAINFSSIAKPQDCSEGSGPAKAIIGLGNLIPGDYNLQILVNENVLQATMTVSSKSIVLSNKEEKWIKILNPELKKIPENAIWGYAAYSNDSSVIKQVPAFFDTLKTIGAQDYDFESGSYSFFDIDSAGAIKMSVIVDLPNVKPFVYLYNKNILSLRSLVKYYGKNKPVSLAIFTTDGDAFYTWELADEP